MKTIYLDNCALQRPHDEKSNARIRLESEAVLDIIQIIENGTLSLISSSILEYELEKTPDPTRIADGKRILRLASQRIDLTEDAFRLALRYQSEGIRAIDALHLAVAHIHKIDFLCTCDDRFLNKANLLNAINTRVLSPISLIMELDNE